MMREITSERARKIKLIVTDIDGVWTDGGLYYTADGLVMKKFNVKDGMGVVRLREAGIETAIISGDNSPVINMRGIRLKLELVYTGIANKIESLDDICKKRNIAYDEIAFIGDDVNDLCLLDKVGLSASPNDAIDEVLEQVDYVCKRQGGQGAFREFADLIIKHKDN